MPGLSVPISYRFQMDPISCKRRLEVPCHLCNFQRIASGNLIPFVKDTSHSAICRACNYAIKNTDDVLPAKGGPYCAVYWL